MAKTIIKSDKESCKTNTPKVKRGTKLTQKAILAELKQGLTEAALISRGEMEGISLSHLWND